MAILCVNEGEHVVPFHRQPAAFRMRADNPALSAADREKRLFLSAVHPSDQVDTSSAGHIEAVGIQSEVKRLDVLLEFAFGDQLAFRPIPKLQEPFSGEMLNGELFS